MSEPSLERDTARWPDAFSGIYARIRYQSYLYVLTLLIIAVQGVLLFAMGTRAAAHVYEVRPDGEAFYIGQRESNLAPRPVEAAWFAQRFVERLYGWNSSTVHDDLTEAINRCDQALAVELRKEVASASYIELIRKKRVRSELAFHEVTLLPGERRYFRVRVKATVNLYPLTSYEGSPVERKPVDVVLVLSKVPRTPERPSGLVVSRLERSPPQDEER